MKRVLTVLSISCILFLIMSFLHPASLNVQSNSKAGLFDSNEILHIKISGNLRTVLNDRAEKSTYQSLNFSYKVNDSSELSFPIQIKTRGRFRKLSDNCSYPPLLLNFAKKNQPEGSIFSKQDKMKLVMPCRGEEYVIREWLLYKIYNLFTPQSLRARLVKVDMDDSQKKKSTSSFYGILLEEEDQMAKRNKMVSLEEKYTRPEQTKYDAFLRMAVFQYFIGNTDWSIQYQQNIKLIDIDSTGKNPIPVPYDFDHAGLVSAPYAEPFEALLMQSIRERRYRGYCIKELKEFESTLQLFNKLKPEIYKLYEDCSLIDEKYKKFSFSFFDEFYKTINNPELLKREFSYPCDPNGTGNVVIKGLKK